MRLCRPLGVAAVLPVGGVLLVAATVGKEPALIMLAAWRLFGKKPVMAEKHHLDMLEPHIGAIPVVTILCRGLHTFRRAGRLMGVIGREMRLAEIGGVIACRCQRSGEPLVPGLRRQVDAVVVNAVRARQLAGQDRGARRLADDTGCDRVGETCSLGSQLVEMRCLDFATLDAEAVGAVLVGGDEQDIWSCHEAVFLAK